MLAISFSGWAQCKLATDPDPYDDPRGVSGYMRAYAGEPDLDRIIRFQDPPSSRTLTPDVGVVVREVVLNGEMQSAHPLAGAKVELVDDPVFEGRNGVIAEDGLEPIAPFHLALRQGLDGFSRATVPSDPRLPHRLREFNAVDLQFDLGFIERATGVADLGAVWRTRLGELEAKLPDASPEASPAIEERIDFLKRNLRAEGGGVAGFFAARMEWDYAIRSEIREYGRGMAALLPGFAPTNEPWRARFWFGGWDADAQMFFVSGELEINASGISTRTILTRRPERMTDIAGGSYAEI